MGFANPESIICDFNAYLTLCAKRVDFFLSNFLQKISAQTFEGHQAVPPQPLFEALKYSLFNGGKRIRPLLVYATGEAFNTPLEQLHAAAAAVELIHCFSLVHDDLPAMDNDDFRRGKPTCHKVFGEANAILVGDALQSLSFELLSNTEFNPNPTETQLKMINTLSKATGIHGMVGGQALDIAAEQKQCNENVFMPLRELDQTQPEYDPNALKILIALHRKKTGVLITASILLGLQASNCQKDKVISGLSQYADLLGLAFQVQDDILDVEGSLESLGKTPGKDAQYEKLTFPKVLGLSGAKQYKKMLHLQILEALNDFSINDPMRSRFEQIAEFFLERRN